MDLIENRNKNQGSILFATLVFIFPPRILTNYLIKLIKKILLLLARLITLNHFIIFGHGVIKTILIRRPYEGIGRYR